MPRDSQKPPFDGSKGPTKQHVLPVTVEHTNQISELPIHSHEVLERSATTGTSQRVSVTTWQVRLKDAGATHPQAVLARTRTPGSEDLKKLDDMYELASTYGQHGRLEDAEALLLRTLETCRRVFGDQQPSTLKSMQSLGSVYKRQGRLKDAETLFLQVVSARKTLLGSQNPDTIASMHRLASNYEDQNMLKEAASIYAEILLMRKYQLGDEHIDTLEAMHLLASVYRRQTQWKTAEKLYQHIARVRKHTLGANHPQTLDTLHHLASIYYRQGQLQKAEEQYLQVLQACQCALGDEHPQTFDSMHDLAMVYREQRRLDEAEALYHRIIPASSRLLGGEHPDTLGSMHCLAHTFYAQGKLEEAEALFLKVLPARRRVLGDSNPHTLDSIQMLASTYKQQGRSKEAQGLYFEVLSARQRTLPEDHRDVLNTMHCLASVYAQHENLEDAEVLYLRVYTTRKLKLGTVHPDTIESWRGLLDVYCYQCRWTEAEALGAELQEACDKQLGELHPSTVAAVNALAIIREQRIQQGAEALEVFVSLGRRPSTKKIIATTFGESPKIQNRESLPTTPVRRLQEDDIATNPDDENTSRGSVLSVIPEPGYFMVFSRSVCPQELFSPPDSSQDIIATSTPVTDAFLSLLDHGCSDLTHMINLSQCSKAALAGGRFGDVWSGALNDQTQIAIKCLRLHTLSEAGEKSVKRATRELYTWSKAKHENVLELLGIAIFREQLAMISPWMSNGTLRSYVCQRPELDRWALCTQVVEGLAYMHEIGMVHGDLKGANILVSGEGIVKLSDFGNAILRNYSLMFTDTTNFGGGTARWMAPELLLDEVGAEPADRSRPADVYALGMTILEVMTGKHPYSEHKSEPRVTVVVMNGVHPQRPDELSSQKAFGDQKWDILKRCWHMKPNGRPTAKNVKYMIRGLSRASD